MPDRKQERSNDTSAFPQTPENTGGKKPKVADAKGGIRWRSEWEALQPRPSVCEWSQCRQQWRLSFTFITQKKNSSQLSLMWLLPSWANEVVQVLAAAAPTYQITSRAQAPFLLLHPTFKVLFQLPKQTDSVIYTIKCTPKHTLEQQELRWNISY